MKQAADYRHHADECRALAATMTLDEHREQLLRMAEMWERLLEDRSKAARARSERGEPPRELGESEPPSGLAGA